MSICHIEQLSVSKYHSEQMSLEQLSCDQLACEQLSFEQMSCEILIGMFRNMRVSKCPSGQLSDYAGKDGRSAGDLRRGNDFLCAPVRA